VTFRYKDYRRNGQARYRTMTLAPDEFIRRFLLHVLPKGFHRIREHSSENNGLEGGRDISPPPYPPPSSGRAPQPLCSRCAPK
jgi:hypothetical protein